MPRTCVCRYCRAARSRHDRRVTSVVRVRFAPSPTGSLHLGNALSDQGLHDEAIDSYRNALQINPDFAEVHSNLGNSLCEFGRYEEAAASYTRALELKPDFAIKLF